MEEFKVDKFLYYRSGTSDKIWGIATYGNANVFKFWGRRPKDLEINTIALTKETSGTSFDREYKKSMTKARNKIAEGYSELSEEDAEKLVPGFKEWIGEKILMAQLTDGFRNGSNVG